MKYTDAIRAHSEPRDETERALAILDVLDLMLGKTPRERAEANNLRPSNSHE